MSDFPFCKPRSVIFEEFHDHSFLIRTCAVSPSFFCRVSLAVVNTILSVGSSGYRHHGAQRGGRGKSSRVLGECAQSRPPKCMFSKVGGFELDRSLTTQLLNQGGRVDGTCDHCQGRALSRFGRGNQAKEAEAVHLSRHASAKTPPDSSLPRCLRPHEGKGIRMGGRLHPGQQRSVY